MQGSAQVFVVWGTVAHHAPKVIYCCFLVTAQESGSALFCCQHEIFATIPLLVQ